MISYTPLFQKKMTIYILPFLIPIRKTNIRTAEIFGCMRTRFSHVEQSILMEQDLKKRKRM